MKNTTQLSFETQLEIIALMEEGWSTEDIDLHLNVAKEQSTTQD